MTSKGFENAIIRKWFNRWSESCSHNKRKTTFSETSGIKIIFWAWGPNTHIHSRWFTICWSFQWVLEEPDQQVNQEDVSGLSLVMVLMLELLMSSRSRPSNGRSTATWDHRRDRLMKGILLVIVSPKGKGNRRDLNNMQRCDSFHYKENDLGPWILSIICWRAEAQGPKAWSTNMNPRSAFSLLYHMLGSGVLFIWNGKERTDKACDTNIWPASKHFSFI